MVTRQLQVECRTRKVRRSKTGFLPLRHATSPWWWWCVWYIRCLMWSVMITITNVLLHLSVKLFWKPVNIWYFGNEDCITAMPYHAPYEPPRGLHHCNALPCPIRTPVRTASLQCLTMPHTNPREDCITAMPYHAPYEPHVDSEPR